jgi:hypothetical protein
MICKRLPKVSSGLVLFWEQRVCNGRIRADLKGALFFPPSEVRIRPGDQLSFLQGRNSRGGGRGSQPPQLASF